MMERYLIIDANVARSCTEPARHETSQACLQLTQVLQRKECKVGIVITPALHDEWRKHASRVFLSWWANMESRRRVRQEDDKRLNDYREYLSSIQDHGIREAMEKDAHLVELALLKGYPVASQDDKQRRYIADISANYQLARTVQWFNPVSSQGWDTWLLENCQDLHIFRCVSANASN